MKNIRWKCTFCGTENKETYICEKCGFDERQNYKRYGTIARLKDNTLKKSSRSWVLRRTWPEKPVIGMDIGTDKIRMAVLVGKNVVTIPFADNEDAIACAVAYNSKDRRILTGNQAEQYAQMHVGSGVIGLLQILEGAWRFSGAEQPYSSVQLLTFLLGRARRDAQRWLGMEVSEVVAAFPCGIDICQKSRILEAMRRAGWKVKRAGNATGFAKVDASFRFKRKGRDAVVCVLGQDAFETAVYQDESDVLEEQALFWNTKIRGRRFEEIETEEDAEDFAWMSKLLTDEIVNQIMTAVQNADCPEQIKEIFLCGEVFTIPGIADQIRQKFAGRKVIVMSRICIAKGAAAYAGIIDKKNEFDYLYMNCCAHDVRVRVWGQEPVTLIRRNSTLPARMKASFKKKVEGSNEAFADIEVWQGNNENFAENKLIAKARVSSLGIEKQGERIDTGMPVYGCKLEVTVSEGELLTDGSCGMQISARDMVNDRTLALNIL